MHHNDPSQSLGWPGGLTPERVDRELLKLGGTKAACGFLLAHSEKLESSGGSPVGVLDATEGLLLDGYSHPSAEKTKCIGGPPAGTLDAPERREEKKLGGIFFSDRNTTAMVVKMGGRFLSFQESREHLILLQCIHRRRPTFLLRDTIVA
ncbi:unnamed protein product [Victoria cruziana]